MKKVYLSFSTDIIHEGHLNIIREAKKYGKLIIGVYSDEAITKFDRYSTLDFEDRKNLFENIPDVEKIVIQNEVSKKKF